MVGIKDVNNYAKYKNSDRLLERAAWYAVEVSWSDADIFDKAQRDAEELILLSNVLSAAAKHLCEQT